MTSPRIQHYQTVAIIILIICCQLESASSFALPLRPRGTQPCLVTPTISASKSSSWSLQLSESTKSEDPNTQDELAGLRGSLRKMTGFSLTALRKTCRAATGISLSAIYLACLAATGNWIRQTTKFVLSALPPWARYFVQPFLILYYVPIFILRNLVGGPTRLRARRTHNAVLDSWKDAVDKADDAVAYWPIHVDEEGYIASDFPEIDLKDGVAESIEVANEGGAEGYQKK